MRDPDYIILETPSMLGLRWRERPDNWPEKTDIVWEKFVVPQDVLDRPSPVTASKAGILNLPLELVLQIFSHASQESSICLALSCKSLLVASTLANLQRPTLPPENRIPFSDYEGAILHPGHPEHLSRRAVIMFSFLIHPLDERLRRSQSVKFCQDCLRYRSREPSWWAGKGAPCPGKVAIGRHWALVVEHWHYGMMLQCPECWYFDHKTGCEGCRERKDGAVRNAPVEKSVHGTRVIEI
ncbi:hypothetical protein J3F84DRAFT_161207 [Trichoderma pleuroticola]